MSSEGRKVSGLACIEGFSIEFLEGFSCISAVAFKRRCTKDGGNKSGLTLCDASVKKENNILTRGQVFFELEFIIHPPL